MENLKFVQLIPNNPDLFDKAKSVWIPFVKEINFHEGIVEDENAIITGLKKRIAIQGQRYDMHFEIALLDHTVIGIAMFAIDLGTIYGLLDHPGYGTIMGFYISPAYRRKGYGRLFYEHIEKTLINDGTCEIYLCPDTITGIPFWSAMGFWDSGKYDPDDKKPIYIKHIDKAFSEIMKNKYTVSRAFEHHASEIWRLYQENLDALHGSPEITENDFADMLKTSWKGIDERNFLIYQDRTPVGWLKINGLDKEDIGWISMLVIAENYHRKGVGTFAVHFAEEYIRSAGKQKAGIHTTDDNIPAQKLYTKCGYTITEYGECTTGDGETRMGYTFEKIFE